MGPDFKTNYANHPMGTFSDLTFSPPAEGKCPMGFEGSEFLEDCDGECFSGNFHDPKFMNICCPGKGVSNSMYHHLPKNVFEFECPN